MRMLCLFVLFLIAFGVSSCSTDASLAATPQVVTVYSTSAAEPWLSKLYSCAGTASVLNRIDDASAAEIALRVGEPARLASPAYQIDTEEILIVTQRQSPVQHLTLDEARALFAGQSDASVQLWIYASGEDVQQVFDRAVMEGRAVAPAAQIAPNPQQMSDTLVNQPNTVGILPGHWKMGDSRFVYTIPNIPVLAITHTKPEGEIRRLISCLQN